MNDSSRAKSSNIVFRTITSLLGEGIQQRIACPKLHPSSVRLSMQCGQIKCENKNLSGTTYRMPWQCGARDEDIAGRQPEACRSLGFQFAGPCKSLFARFAFTFRRPSQNPHRFRNPSAARSGSSFGRADSNTRHRVATRYVVAFFKSPIMCDAILFLSVGFLTALAALKACYTNACMFFLVAPEARSSIWRDFSKCN